MICTGCRGHSGTRQGTGRLSGALRGLGRQIDELVSPEQEADAIRWFETHPQSLRLNSTPLDVADVFRLQMQRHPAAWIFTSATLAVGDSFEHFQRQLGLDDALTCKWDSPFDYPNQALWYVPRGMPQPSDPGYTRAVVDLVLPIVEASAGRAFLLFTSHRALREAADLLHEHLTFPLLVQGNAPKAELLERFVGTAMRCCSVPRVSGKAWMSVARPCRW